MKDSASRPARTILGQGKYLRLVKEGNWEYVQRTGVAGVVGIVPITDEGKVVLIRQYRPPMGQTVIEMPAGLVGDEAARQHEQLVDAALRELEEETGYRAAKMSDLSCDAVSAGLCDEVIASFLATGLTKVGDGGGDHTEEIEVCEVPLSEVDDWLARQRQLGAMIDIKVYAGLYLARRMLDKT